jgi:hypothetical protein
MDFEELILPGIVVGGAIWMLSRAVTPQEGDGSVMGQSYPAAVIAIAKFINIAEESGRVDPRTNNPGNLEMGDVGHGTWNNKTIFATPEDGWNALYDEVGRMLGLHGKSMYSPGMTIAQIAAKYTATDPAAWAQNFSIAAGVTPDTTLNDVAQLHA